MEASESKVRHTLERRSHGTDFEAVVRRLFPPDLVINVTFSGVEQASRQDAVVKSMLNHQRDVLSTGAKMSIIYCDGNLSLDPAILNSGSQMIYISPQGSLNIAAPTAASLPSIVSSSKPQLALTEGPANTYYCSDCPNTFDSRELLDDHNKLAHPSCDVCYGKFASREEHMATHPKCTWCFQTFQSNSILDMHSIEAHPRCVWCQLQFSTRTLLDQHAEISHPTCRKCHRKFSNWTERDDHSKETHPACILCPFEAVNFQQQDQHMMAQHPRCFLCTTEPFRSLDDYNRHFHTAHYYCMLCRQYHKSMDEYLDLHAKCTTCHIRLNSIDEMSSHMSIMHPVCTYCPHLGQFASSNTYTAHMGANHPQCPTCSKHYATPERLASHIHNSHPHCQQCFAIFTSRSELRKHRAKMHPICSLCPSVPRRHFATVASLNQHTQEVHFPCGSCFVFFASEEQRDEHVGLEHPSCGVCGKPCGTRMALRSHMARRH